MKSRIAFTSALFISIMSGVISMPNLLRAIPQRPEEATRTSSEELWRRAAANILDHYFKPPEGREIVILHDQEKTALARRLAAGLTQRGCRPKELLAGDDFVAGAESFREIQKDKDVGLMVLASPRMFRGLRLHEHMDFTGNTPSIRCFCSPVFFDTVIPLENLVRLFAADPAEIAHFLAGLGAELPERSLVRIVAPGGTDLTFGSRTWMPWPWEIATYPVEESINGRIVVDGAVFFAKIVSPIRLLIRDGKLVEIRCDQREDRVCERYVREMNRMREADPQNWQLAEVGIGGNRQARLSNILMESESVRGTCHFCFGDNLTFGGKNKTSWHGGTVIVHQPTLHFGDKRIQPRD